MMNRTKKTTGDNKNYIDYPDSPTGRAYAGINKEPFMKVENGHGYFGVLLQDETRERVQCHSCGEWHKRLTNWHVKRCANMTITEYKKKYHLNIEKPFLSYS
jgi:hypothetical protein